MVLTESIIKTSKARLPDNYRELISRSKQRNAMLMNSSEALKKRAILLTEANVPASIVHERILGANDYQEMNYFNRGIKAGNAVCRIIVKLKDGISFGTGFLICDGLIMTNNHVLDAPETGSEAHAEFDYELDEDNNIRKITRVKVEPQNFFYTNKELDFTIVAISPSQSKRYKIRLIHETGKAVYNEALSIIQHPDGREKKMAVRNNVYLKSTDTTIWYSTDTSPGSSGSPVFNDDWQLVALHHSGIPDTTSDGKFILLDGTNVNSLANIQESKIKWIANEGIRVSSIVEDLDYHLQVGTLTHFNLYDELKGVYDSSSLRNATIDSVNILPMKTETNSLLSIGKITGNGESVMEVNRPGLTQIIINMAGPTGLNGQPMSASSNGLLHADVEKPKVKVKIDPDYRNRHGFQKDFLHMELDLEKIVAKAKVKLSKELMYHHFSIFMASPPWKMPYVTAVNIDGNRFVDLNRPSDAWYFDSRIPTHAQLGNDVYRNNKLDRGHMIRREDPSWGTPEEALKATFDTYHFTNACPQHEKLNQGKMEWQGLENYILDLAVQKKLRLSVLTGPVLQNKVSEYESYRDCRVPMQFYKVVVVNNVSGNGVFAAGYIQSQYYRRTNFEAAYEPEVHQRSIAVIMKLTSLDLSELISVDTFDSVVAEPRLQESLRRIRKNLVDAYGIRTIADIMKGLKLR